MENSLPKLLTAVTTMLPVILAVPAICHAMPSVSGDTLTWPDDGWYQVQRADTFETVCEGNVAASSATTGGPCIIDASNYIVINHSTGERFENISAGSGTSSTALPSSPVTGVVVDGSQIRWPDNGWYQVQDAMSFASVCEGGTSCTVQPGTYVVINHSTGERFNDIAVGAVGALSSIVADGNRIRWPNDGWYQVQDAMSYASVCEGGTECQVSPGNYIVINHSTGERTPITVSGGASSGGTTTPDLTGQLLTRVEFTITVPAYVSNSLQVIITWNDISLSAGWVVDETWRATADFPSDTENNLNVTFFDRNGEIVLGSFDTNYRTGTSASETIQVSADQFDTNPDTDNDGVSNIRELIAGTDPLVAETRELPILDKYRGGANAVVLPSFETIAFGQRPNVFHEVMPVGSIRLNPTGSSTRTIDIDASGNGTFFYTTQHSQGSSNFLQERVGTRTNTGNSIVWMGSEYNFNRFDEFSNDVNFTVEATRIDAERIRVEATYETAYLREPRIGVIITRNYNLVVIDAAGTRNCLPDRGTYTSTTNNPSEGYTFSTTITKNPGDEYWHVLTTNRDGTSDEYLVPWLQMEVYCRYADLE